VRKVSAHLHLAGASRISNIWLLEDSMNRKFLVDTGHPVERLPLLASLWKLGIRRPGDLTAVLLTHRHSDHAGNAAWLRRQFGARVICHADDARILSGEKPAPPLKRGVGRFYDEWLCGLEDKYPAVCEVDETYETGASWKWGFRVVPVPGHTEGSVMLYHEPTATLFSGDAILVGFPLYRSARSLRLAIPAYSLDIESCHRAVRRFLKELPPTEVLCSGHGPALTDAPRQRLLKLLK
jgi:glyoxylase-like metal-dependent hydrolase (beta-lactamase superfamily II)